MKKYGMWYKFSKICMAAVILTAAGGNIALAKNSEPEATGIQAGNFVIHPGLDVSAAYDMRDNDSSAGGTLKHDDGLVDVGVHLNTHLLDETSAKWDNNIEFKWRQFWGLGDAEATGGPNVSVSTAADLFLQKTFRFAPSASYYYVTDPEDDNLRKDLENHHVRAGVDFYIQPGAGAIFSQKIGYQLSTKLYPDRWDISHMTHRVTSLTRWNFMPHTSMALDVDFRYVSYIEDSHRTVVAGEAKGPSVDNHASYPIRVKYDLNGLLLSRLSYSLGLGYAYESGSGDLKEHMFIMNARLRYDFTQDIGLFVEYRKDFDNHTEYDYYKFHRVTLGFNALWFDHLQTDFSVGYGAFDVVDVRKENLVSAEARIFYHFIPGFKLGFEYRLRYNTSNSSSSDYLKNMFMLSLAYEY